MIRLVLPYHLRTLAKVDGEVTLDLDETHATLGQALDALESLHPVLRGLIRDHATLQRRPFIRFYACSEDISFTNYSEPLPAPVRQGYEPLYIVGAMAGG